MTKKGRPSFKKEAFKTNASLVTSAEYSPPSNSASRLSLKPDFSGVSKKVELASKWERPAGADLEPAFLMTTFKDETVSEDAGAVLIETARSADVEKCLADLTENIVSVCVCAGYGNI